MTGPSNAPPEEVASRAEEWFAEAVEHDAAEAPLSKPIYAKCATCNHMRYQHGPERCLDCRSSDAVGAAIAGVVVCTQFVEVAK